MDLLLVLLILSVFCLLQELIAIIILLITPFHIWRNNDIDPIMFLYPFYGLYLMYKILIKNKKLLK